MMKLVVDYPEYSEEREMIGRFTIGAVSEVQPVVDSEYVLKGDDWAKAVELGRWPEQVRPYTRNRRQVLYGPIVGG